MCCTPSGERVSVLFIAPAVYYSAQVADNHDKLMQNEHSLGAVPG